MDRPSRGEALEPGFPACTAVTPSVTEPLVIYTLSLLPVISIFNFHSNPGGQMLLDFIDEETEAESDCMISRSHDY